MTNKPDLKTTAGKIEDLDRRLTESVHPLGEGADDAGQDAGQLTARTRIDALLDAGSFVETDALARHRSVDFNREHNKPLTEDRKSTRLNSSHVAISYAVFCLKNKNTDTSNYHLHT